LPKSGHRRRRKILAAVLHKASLWQRISLKPVNEWQRRAINRMLNGF